MSDQLLTRKAIFVIPQIFRNSQKAVDHIMQLNYTTLTISADTKNIYGIITFHTHRLHSDLHRKVPIPYWDFSPTQQIETDVMVVIRSIEEEYGIFKGVNVKGPELKWDITLSKNCSTLNECTGKGTELKWETYGEIKNKNRGPQREFVPRKKQSIIADDIADEDPPVIKIEKEKWDQHNLKNQREKRLLKEGDW